MRPVCRPATPADLEAFYGRKMDRTMRAWVLELDGRIIAVGGLAYHRGRPWDLFSDITPELKAHPIAALKAAKAVLAGMRHLPAVALADCNLPNSERVLKMLGLEPIGNGGYQWLP